MCSKTHPARFSANDMLSIAVTQQADGSIWQGVRQSDLLPCAEQVIAKNVLGR